MTDKPSPSPDPKRKKRINAGLYITGGLSIAVGLYRLLVYRDPNVRLYFVMGLFLIFIPFITRGNSE